MLNKTSGCGRYQRIYFGLPAQKQRGRTASPPFGLSLQRQRHSNAPIVRCSQPARINLRQSERENPFAPRSQTRQPGCSHVLIPFMARSTYPPGAIATMGDIQRPAPHWCWIYCNNAFCERISRPTAIALAPYVIRWGADASSNMLRRSARCRMCGHKGASLRVKQTDPDRDDYASFPIEPEWIGDSRKEIFAAGGWYVLSSDTPAGDSSVAD